jgi:exosortase E/protease (VPEID-CTERM system)
MSTDTLPRNTPHASPADGTAGPRDWRAIQLLAAIIAAEACLLVWFLIGGWLRELDGKRWAIFTTLAVLGGLQAHVREHRDDYRAVRISWPLIAAQILAFAGVFAYVGWLAAGATSTPLGGPGELAVGAVLAAAWAVSSLAVVVPRLDLARQLLGTALGLGIFAFAAWQVGGLAMTFWKATGDSTVRLVGLLLGPFAGGPVVRPDTFVIGTPDFQVSIEEPCCGFQGIGLITTLLAGYLWWFRSVHRFPQSLLLLPIGAALMWLANAVRIAALILVGIWISPDIAVDGFHSVAGWLAFLAVGLGIIWAASRIPFFTRCEPAPAAGAALVPPSGTTMAEATWTTAARPTAIACLVPFLALTAATMLTQAFTSGFDRLYPLRVIVVAAALWQLRHAIPWGQCRISPAAVAIGIVTFVAWMALAPGADAALAATRDPTPLGRPWSALWLLFRVAGSTLTVPIAEELFFRGFVTRRCIAADVDAVPIGGFSWLSFLLSSVAFGILHGDAWVAGTVAGMLFALALYTRRNIWDAVVAHATTNALVSGYVLATGSWSQWG